MLTFRKHVLLHLKVRRVLDERVAEGGGGVEAGCGGAGAGGAAGRLQRGAALHAGQAQACSSVKCAV